MNGEINTTINTLPPFKYFINSIGELPSSYLESMSYYETLLWLCNYLKETIIPTVNNTGNAVTELQNLYIQLQNYVNNYFNNLDVQEEINNKLDDMAQDGSLTLLIKNYVDPLINEVNEDLEEHILYVQNELNRQNTKIQAVESGSPLVASSTAGMTDTSRVYVNTTDGNWYYYNGSNWVIGGVYQASEDSDTVYMLKNPLAESDNLFNPLTVTNNYSLSSSTGEPYTDNNYYITDFISITKSSGLYSKPVTNNFYFYDENKSYLGYYSTNKERVSGSDIPEGTMYVRCPYKKSVVSFEDRFNIRLMQRTFFNKYNDIPHFAINNQYIIADSLGIGLLNDSIKSGIVTSNMDIGIKPFTLDDLMECNIDSSGGFLNLINGKRLSLLIYLYVKKGTTFSMSTNQFRLYEYDKNTHNYIGEIGSVWRKTYTFNEDKVIRFTLRKTDDSYMSSEERQAIYDEFTITYNDPLVEKIERIEEQIIVPEGTPLEYYGEKITLNNKCYFSQNIGISTYGQDGCVYNGLNFEVGNQGTFKVTDMETLTNYGNFELDQKETILPHANSVCFGNEFYDENDEFPLLYINAYNNTSLPKGACYVYRVQRDSSNQFTTTLVQTIRIGFTNNELWSDSSDDRPYGNFAVDTDNNYLYVFTMRNGLKLTRFFKFNLPKLSDGETVILNTSDIIEYFDTPFQPYIQGCQYYKNKIFSSCGINSAVANSSSLRVIDLLSKTEVANIPTSIITNEPETVAFYNNKMVFGGSQLLFIDFG